MPRNAFPEWGFSLSHSLSCQPSKGRRLTAVPTCSRLWLGCSPAPWDLWRPCPVRCPSSYTVAMISCATLTVCCRVSFCFLICGHPVQWKRDARRLLNGSNWSKVLSGLEDSKVANDGPHLSLFPNQTPRPLHVAMFRASHHHHYRPFSVLSTANLAKGHAEAAEQKEGVSIVLQLSDQIAPSFRPTTRGRHTV